MAWPRLRDLMWIGVGITSAMSHEQVQGQISMIRRFLLPLLAILLAGCAQNSIRSSEVRICDDQGCSYRQKDQVSEEFGINRLPAEDPRIVALKESAKTEPKAAYDLGLRYFRGDGIAQDSHQALVWMRRAAEAGNLHAQKALGSFYLFGLEEMGSDPREAEKWLSLAASRGDQESRTLLNEARAAKKSDEEDYKWRARWRDMYYSYWYSGYAYLGAWNQASWYWQ